MRRIDWNNIDKSNWGKRPDPEIAADIGVTDEVIAYWRKKFGIPSYDDYFLGERERQYTEGKHWCSTCKSFRPVADFGRARKGRNGLRAECNDCRKQNRDANQEVLRQQKRASYERHGERVRAKNNARYHSNPAPRLAAAKELLSKSKRLFVELAGGSCHRCGYSEFMSALEFHHVDPELKDVTPVKLIKSGNYERIYPELDKCALLCRNCHQSFHAKEWAADFIKRDGLGWTINRS